jgi:hypothetical protein
LFDSGKEFLQDILKEAVSGALQIPEFQRGWVWDDGHVRDVITSIARGFPIGSAMFMQTSEAGLKFKYRPVENVPIQGELPAKRLILDGQQRITALTQVLCLDGPVQTKNEKDKRILRHYYLHIPTAMQKPPELFDEALIPVDENHRQIGDFGAEKLDLSDRKFLCQNLYFPCREIFNSDVYEQDVIEHNSAAALSDFMKFRGRYVEPFRKYQIPVITLLAGISKAAICMVFERVNTGGVQLSVFELVTASYAADGYNLREDWLGDTAQKLEGRQKRLAKEPVLAKLETTEFLQTIALLATLERHKADLKAMADKQDAVGEAGDAKATPRQPVAVSAKRDAILDLTLAEYQAWADKAEAGFKLAAKFLRKEAVRALKDLPYRSQIPPLAAILAHLGDRWLEPKINEKLSRWYWCGVLGEFYGSGIENKMANDVVQVLSWIDGTPLEQQALPKTVEAANFHPDTLDRLQSRLSAAFKGINVLVVREGARDFFWKDVITNLDKEDTLIDIHHIFPKDWCEKNGVTKRRMNAIVNKTPISYKANRKIGGKEPSKYLEKIQAEKTVALSDPEMDKILETHLIPAAALRGNQFNIFYEERKKALYALILKTMGKEASNAAPAPEESAFDQEDDEEQTEAA